MQWRSLPNFSAFKIGRRELVINREIAAQAAEIVQRLGELAAASEAGAGNRRSAFRLKLAGGLELFARRGRRGGMIGSILSDVYVGITPRPLNELALTVEAMRRGIPVAEPMGAMIEWIGPALYRGFFLTRAVRGMTLWEFVKTDDDPIVRGHVLGQARAAIDTMHEQGALSRRSQSAQYPGDASAREFQRDHYRPGQSAAVRWAVAGGDAPGERGALDTVGTQARSVRTISRRIRPYDSVG